MSKYLIIGLTLLCVTQASAQDVPGIENCSAEKAMERRTGCLQANVNYLHAQLNKAGAENRQRLDAANKEIAALKETVAKLQTGIDELRAAAKKAVEPKPK